MEQKNLALQPAGNAIPPSKEVRDYETMVLQQRETSRLMLEVVSGGIDYDDVSGLLEASSYTFYESRLASEAPISADEFNALFEDTDTVKVVNAHDDTVLSTPTIFDQQMKHRGGLLHEARQILSGKGRKISAMVLAGALTLTAACSRSAPAEEDAASITPTTVGFITSGTTVGVPSDLPEGAVATTIIVGSVDSQNTVQTLSPATEDESNSEIDTTSPQVSEPSSLICIDNVAPGDGITNSMLRFAEYAKTVGILDNAVEITGEFLWRSYLRAAPEIERSGMDGLYRFSPIEWRISEAGSLSYTSEVCQALYGALQDEAENTES